MIINIPPSAKHFVYRVRVPGCCHIGSGTTLCSVRDRRDLHGQLFSEELRNSWCKGMNRFNTSIITDCFKSARALISLRRLSQFCIMRGYRWMDCVINIQSFPSPFLLSGVGRNIELLFAAVYEESLSQFKVHNVMFRYKNEGLWVFEPKEVRRINGFSFFFRWPNDKNFPCIIAPRIPAPFWTAAIRAAHSQWWTSLSNLFL